MYLPYSIHFWVREVRNHARIMQNHTESRFWSWFKLRQILPNLFRVPHHIWNSVQMCFNVKIFVKIQALTANLSHIPRVQKPGLRPTALAFLYPRPGQKPAQAKSQARLGLARLLASGRSRHITRHVTRCRRQHPQSHRDPENELGRRWCGFSVGKRHHICPGISRRSCCVAPSLLIYTVTFKV